MAIYHFSAKVISRAAGSSALASAAYRSASRLHDQRLDRHHDFSNKAGVVHSEVMLPEGAPEHLSDREKLWNEVEAAEKRIDAQLAREIEFAIPRELTQEQGIELARDFVRAEFVDRGMIADLNVHWDIGADGLAKPHAHVMLTMREVGEDGFGKKNRDWNRTELLEKWRERWAEHANQRLAELDIDACIDHRSLEGQGIELEPQHKIGPAAARMAAQGLQLERVEEHREIARANGDKIISEPRIALDAITRTQATFTTRDLAMFAHRHSEGKDQFDQVMGAVRGSPELVALGKDGRGEDRFTSRDMIETERRLARETQSLAEREHHGVAERDRERAIASAERRGLVLSAEQRSAFEHATNARDLGVVIGYAGTGKSAMLGVAREAWESAGYQVQGLALSGIAAENLESGSGIASRTIASLEHQWSQGRELLTSNHVLVIDEAGMIGSRQMERVIAEAEKRGAKVVLVGDPEQLQAIEAGAAFRSIAERHGSIEITEVRRQREDWQRDATRQLATGRTAEALNTYREAGMVVESETRTAAREALIDRWDRARTDDPAHSRVILTHTNEECDELNGLARDRMKRNGTLVTDIAVKTTRGERLFAAEDRIMFLRNERELGVKNGSLGTIEQVDRSRMAGRLDDGRHVAFDFKDYRTSRTATPPRSTRRKGSPSIVRMCWRRRGSTGTPPMSRCHGIAMPCISTTAATTSPTPTGSRARCRATGRRTARSTMSRAPSALPSGAGSIDRESSIHSRASGWPIAVTPHPSRGAAGSMAFGCACPMPSRHRAAAGSMGSSFRRQGSGRRRGRIAASASPSSAMPARCRTSVA